MDADPAREPCDDAPPPYEELRGARHPVKAWVRGLGLEAKAEQQLRRTANLPFIHKWLAAMPDVHLGRGATVGSVIPTRGAIIPAAVGVDIGCGMTAVRTSLRGKDLPAKLKPVRLAIEAAVPHGTMRKSGDHKTVPHSVRSAWSELERGYAAILAKRPELASKRVMEQLGTLGGGNHFIELCLDEEERVWVMLHSGSRGVGNLIGRCFIELAKEDCRRRGIGLEDSDLAWFDEGQPEFADYLQAVGWAQGYAARNRKVMMDRVLDALRRQPGLRRFKARDVIVDCHHNYVAQERHYGEDCYVTRKGAVRAGRGELGIIPGSMGARSFIVRGLGQPESFESCSHGAGRMMSRSEARRRISLKEHSAATAEVECRRDAALIDESPAAYKPIELVMAAQQDLVEVLHTLRQVICVKG